MIKRLIDLFASITLLLLLSPVMIAVALLIRLKIGKPVLFKQIRPGLNGRPFTLMKFRSMTDERNEQGQWLNDQQRLTPIGAFLRSTSLDELPQLINVVKGELSLVGPRPLLMDYLPLYTKEQSRRHEVKPGITGWAQVNGRNSLSWEETFNYDVHYVDHQSLLLDIKILLLTIKKVIGREGIQQQGHATKSPFKGFQQTKP
ncbi:sugar transferase [Salipaludibacillus keqinensis]|uniref:Sugar transferase n=1 Tax=Salipaludibacillus keqinensis TaxID=2045207 RepID=A0A323TZQ8_9BACI|nr:sugar transferase [Salipaludibacillus keqinensis]PYZ95085.1 sugar transferase [Salipaludibacillus keqinensis]